VPPRIRAWKERKGGGVGGRRLSTTSSIDGDGNQCGGDDGDEVQGLHEDELEAEAAEELVVPISIQAARQRGRARARRRR
jgi:hypothetical protein